MPGNPARGRHGLTNPRNISDARVQTPMGLPPIYEVWTPGIQGLDPRCTETGPPTDKATRPGLHQTRTKDFVGFKTSQDLGLRGIQDFAGLRTSWDSRLRGTRDFMGSKPLRKTGTLHTSDQDFVLWCSLREHKLSG